MVINWIRPLLFITLLFLGYGFARSQTAIILDTDLDSDVDDVGTLAMMHTLADHKVIKVLGIIVTSDDRYAPSCADAMNHFYQRPHIPIGVEKNIALRHHSRYTKEISEEYPKRLNSYEEAEDATQLYRKLLASQPDSSVVIVTVGHLTNLMNLLRSSADAFSSLSGIELVRKKVKLWSCMGGKFPQGKEANFYRPDPSSTQFCVQNWPNQVVFAGWEVGNEIITGGDFLRSSLPMHHPVWRSYELFNNFAGRQSWDQAALLYAVADTGLYWSINDKGYCRVEPDGSNRWVEGSTGNQSYLIQKMNPNEIAKIMDALMIGEFHLKYLTQDR